MEGETAVSKEQAAALAAWLRRRGPAVSPERAAELAAQAERLEQTMWRLPVPEATEPWGPLS